MGSEKLELIDKKKQGKRNRAAGGRFELKVRKELESEGWIVDKWSNNVELINAISGYKRNGKVATTEIIGRLIPAKRKFNPFKKIMSIGTGFPDFIAFRDRILSNANSKEMPNVLYEVIGCECKTNGRLDKIEKEKCRWLLENKIFSRIMIASKGKTRGTIKFKRFAEKEGKNETNNTAS